MMKNPAAKKFIVDSNVITPILNLVNSGDSQIVNDWFRILSDLCQDADFLEQYARLENLELLLFRMLSNSTKETNTQLLNFL